MKAGTVALPKRTQCLTYSKCFITTYWLNEWINRWVNEQINDSKTTCYQKIDEEAFYLGGKGETQRNESRNWQALWHQHPLLQGSRGCPGPHPHFRPCVASSILFPFVQWLGLQHHDPHPLMKLWIQRKKKHVLFWKKDGIKSQTHSESNIQSF